MYNGMSFNIFEVRLLYMDSTYHSISGVLMGPKSIDSIVGTKPATEAQLDSATFNSGMVLHILRSGQFIDGIYVFL